MKGSRSAPIRSPAYVKIRCTINDLAQATGVPLWAPIHTQGKIERWHQTLKNRILLENYFLPGDLEAQIEAFVELGREMPQMF